MQFARPRRRRVTESVVPMINVVFLLLIFFMMSARIAPAPPFDLTLPTTDSDAELAGELTLYISADGVVAFEGQQETDAWAALGAVAKEQQLIIRADAALPAPRLAAILARVAALGLSNIDLAIRIP